MPAHEIMTLFVLRKLILQTRMRSHQMGLDLWFLIEPFVYFHTLCERTAKALARLRGCAGSPDPSLVAYVISTIISWAGSFILDIDITLHSDINILQNKNLVKKQSSDVWLFYIPCLVMDLVQMRLVTRKPVFGVFDQVRLKPACSASDDS